MGGTFADVDAAGWSAPYIEAITAAGITNGCGNGNYCPDQNVNREQMAALIVRAVEGTPAADTCASGSGFADVAVSAWSCVYIKRLNQLGITAGCGGGNYCPGQLVNREQMAVFIIRALEGAPAADTCSSGSDFGDVANTAWSCAHIKRMKQLGITTGCGGGNYCPTQPVTREQMAAFLARAFLGYGSIPFVLKNQDAAAHAPPSGVTIAQYDYNLFTPDAANFPAVGGLYTDPVFGAPVRRLTNVLGNTNREDIYAHHWANADGTLAFTNSPTSFDIVRVADGTKPHVNQPHGYLSFETYWDALDPDKYYFYDGASLIRRNLRSQTSTTIKTFPAALESLGGSLNFQSRDGRYFVIQYGGTAKVWDSQTDTIYAGSFAPLDSTGWVSITPDGKHVVTAGGWSHYSYAIDHATKSIASFPVMFWDRCGDHGVLISASDGKSYFITHSCYNTPGVYRVDITKNQSGRSDAQQLADNQLLLNVGWGDNDGHFSAVSRGPLANWVFVDTENFTAQFGPYDDFDSSTAGWTPYRQEIIAINVITLEVRRLAHHRSRGLSNSYYNQPRVSCAWDGSAVLWTSNFNIDSPPGYADMYAIQSPLR